MTDKKPARFKYIAIALIAALSVSGCGINVNIERPQEASAETASSSTDEPDDRSPGPSVSLRDAVASAEGLGEDAICGTCIGLPGIGDERLLSLVEEHFNAVTLENELKPDSLFGNNKERIPGGSLHEEELGGRSIMVPTLDHSEADAILDKILEYNDSHPDKPMRVRGHVLVWHQQTPEWFFHTDYDKNKDYVSPEEMNGRLEWYIRSVLTYYTGPESKYSSLFYAWDVVNEAISDRTGSYRTDTEDSSWWKVYGSNEYIINAFRYANLYAPKDIDLYYNDYNECVAKKSKGILTLIEDVKSDPDARIDGFGMQGHYTVNFPTAEDMGKYAKIYADAAGTVMITELDVKTSMLFHGTEDELPKEFERQAAYYAKIYDELIKLKKEGCDIAGITFWGTVDTYSWLNQNGTHYPLLFDKNYEPKPAFYAFMKKGYALSDR